MSKYFHIGFYQYLFSDLDWADSLKHKLQIIICRAKGHPAGRVFYNPGGFEPDNSCKNCGDEI